jgi:tRNA (guanine37-N1)-methyltransferase
LESKLVEIEFTNIRDFTADKHCSVDDRPYGGGPGMVFKPEPVLAAVEHVLERAKAAPALTRKIILSPQGRRLGQKDLRDLAASRWIILLCGRYEGFDERILQRLCSDSQAGFEELSVGDYVLSGGEIPAMVVLDGVIRLVPGALGDPRSNLSESFESGLLDYPQYTRPPEYQGMHVPEVLLSGNHKLIEEWRKRQAIEKTRERRRDLLLPEDLHRGDAESSSLKSCRENWSSAGRAEPARPAGKD